MASSTLGDGDAGGVVMGSASLTMGDGAGVISARGIGCFVIEMTGRSTLGVTEKKKKQNDTRRDQLGDAAKTKGWKKTMEKIQKDSS